MKHKLTVCHNCNELYIDLNPANSSIDIEIDDNYIGLPSTIHIPDPNSKFGEEFIGCPKCLTDGYLEDIIDEKQVVLAYHHTEESMEIHTLQFVTGVV